MVRDLKPCYIIFSPSFDENVGGIVALHSLCDRLNQLGEKAFLWPNDRPCLWVRGSAGRKLQNIAKWLIYARNRLGRKSYRTHPSLVTPMAKHKYLHNAIVVYPEIYNLNPLDADAVVRWILYKPGALTKNVNFSPRGIFFFFQEFFRDEALIPEGGSLLQVHWVRDDIYKQTNYGQRTGSCYLIKKGAGRDDIRPPAGSICIDYKTHEEIARIFNQVKYFYSYDLYTMYSDYAAMCGCISIVVPPPAVTKEEWREAPEARFGIAYGVEDEDWSLETRQKLLDRVAQQQVKDTAMVQKFVKECDSFFQSKVGQRI